MQEQVPFSMPMEYHHGLFFSFFYARTGALLFANGISSPTFLYK
jgi:hypothetical protein